MKTEDLIEALALGLEPVRPARLSPAYLAAAGLISAVAVWLGLGFRPDLLLAMAGPAFWLKALYTLGLAGLGLWLATRLGQPGASARWPALGLAGLAGLALVLALTELAMLAPDQRLDAWLGTTWRTCPLLILGVSVLAAPPVLWTARRFAPTRPALMGAAVGLGTAGLAATAYGLYCAESSASFVASWYSLGIALSGLAGAVAGRLSLRW